MANKSNQTSAHEQGLEAAAEAIWDTWCASPAGQETAPEGGALSWAEMVKASESAKFTAMADMVALTRQEAAAAVSAYERRANTEAKESVTLGDFVDGGVQGG